MPPVDERQTLLFSATFPDQIQSFAANFLRKDYLFIKVGIVGGACADVTQRLIRVETAEAIKTQQLEDIVKNVGETNQRTLVFVETKRKADFIACMLSQTKIPTTSPAHPLCGLRAYGTAPRFFKRHTTWLIMILGIRAHSVRFQLTV